MTISSELNRLLSQGVSGNQAQLVQALGEQGVHTTQSSVSRALKKINAVKGQDGSGNTVYALAEPGLREASFLDSLVDKIVDNGYQIVIQTRPGTANTVAKFIDDYKFDTVLGSVAGDDTIIIVPSNVSLIRQTVREIASYMKHIGIFVE
ncbi:MAG: ArgR family transcriptional regulator [Desulfobacteraceae bacterium]|nr:ArgR family transcriptional regulator [Desulfobacteraceae bacterium]